MASITTVSAHFEFWSVYLEFSVCDPGPNDCTEKVDPYLKNHHFSASNSKYFNSLSSFWMFGCIPRIFYI